MTGEASADRPLNLTVELWMERMHKARLNLIAAHVAVGATYREFVKEQLEPNPDMRYDVIGRAFAFRTAPLENGGGQVEHHMGSEDDTPRSRTYSNATIKPTVGNRGEIIFEVYPQDMRGDSYMMHAGDVVDIIETQESPAE